MSTESTPVDSGTEAETVALLAQQAAAAEALEPGEVVALAQRGGGVRIADLEEFDAHPRRLKADRVVYDAASFARYLERHWTTASEVYADQASARIVGILDASDAVDAPSEPGRPGWQQHRITLALTKSPAWLAWEKNDGALLPQAEFAEFAELQANDVRDPSPADLLELAQRLEITKAVEYESGERLADGQTSLHYKETLTARAGQRGSLEIPSKILLGLKPYIGGPTYGVTARFRYRLQGQALRLGYVLERPHLILESAFNDVVNLLREGDESAGVQPVAAPIFLGKP